MKKKTQFGANHSKQGNPSRQNDQLGVVKDIPIDVYSGIGFYAGGPIILTHHNPFPCALRKSYSRAWGDGVNENPGWESSIDIVSSQKLPVLKGPEERKVVSGLKS
ncbi:hypothetical protein AVEN_109317-1 [Araneus ventricosus]|uniref:Uncharacterized protein n=1 Tax=Araneus ventricosus TaxID=182803 RepID=A0A4Y2D1D7_ARAVE|nr:hypothetical protein AVEN_109317-1 [Araneus ventricosus]